MMKKKTTSLINMLSSRRKIISTMIERLEFNYYPIVTKIFANLVLINKLKIGNLLLCV